MTCCGVKTETLDEIWSISRSVSATASFSLDYLSLSGAQHDFITTTRNVTSVAVFPQLVSSCSTFLSSAREFFTGKVKSVQSMILDGLSALGTACDSVTTSHNLGLLKVGRAVPLLGAVSDAITVLTDGVDFFKHIGEVRKNHKKSESSVTKKKKEFYDAKSSLALLRTIKKAVSVAIAAFCLLSLFFVSLSTFGVLVVLGSVVFLAFNLTDFFYSRSIDEKRKSVHQGKSCLIV